MNFFSIKKAAVFRFKRWSGKSYSTFNSLGKEVNIGTLSYVITNKMGVKSTSMPFQQKALMQDIPKDEDENPEDGFPDVLAILWDLLILLLLGEVKVFESGRFKSAYRINLKSTAFLSPLLLFSEPIFLSPFSPTSQFLRITTIYLLNFSRGTSIYILKPVNYAF